VVSSPKSAPTSRVLKLASRALSNRLFSVDTAQRAVLMQRTSVTQADLSA
jgi:hypothetical protein